MIAASGRLVTLGWESDDHLFYVQVRERECLDVAKALWLTGAEYVSLTDMSGYGSKTWRYIGKYLDREASRRGKRAGYSP